MGKLDIKVSPKQKQFLQSKSQGVIYLGGIGSGKTKILTYKAILNALKKRKELVISNTFTQLRDVVLVTFIESLPLFGLKEFDDYTINKSDMDIIIRGTYIHLRSAEQKEKLRGLNIHDFFIDEARNISDNKLFMILLGRLRNADDCQWYITTTPYGRDWVYDLTLEKNVEVIRQRTEENPFLPQEYIDQLRQRYTSQLAAQELDAEIIEGRGTVINSDWFNVIESPPRLTGMRFWDLAITTKQTSDYSAGAWCLFNGPRFIICDITHGRWEYPALRKEIIRTARHDGRQVQIGVEAISGFQAVFQDLKSEPFLRGYILRSLKHVLDKLSRIQVWAAKAENGLVDIVHGDWNAEFFNECNMFTTGKDTGYKVHDDQLDAISGAHEMQMPKPTMAKKIVF